MAASVPDRRYDLAGSLLADAVAGSTRTGTPVEESLHAVASEAGHRIGASARTGDDATDDDPRALVMAVLADHGYEPEPAPRGEIVLANCPFHRLAEEHRDLVCGMNLDLLDGLLAGAAPAAGLTRGSTPSPVSAASASRPPEAWAACAPGAPSSAARGPDPSAERGRGRRPHPPGRCRRGRTGDSRRPASRP